MEFFGLIDVIRDYCSENAISFIYGNDAYANALMDSSTYEANDLILIADFTCVPVIEGGRVTSCKYSGVMSLGQKCEEGSRSSLGETPGQKYDRRLKYLSTKITSIIGDISCNNELEVTNANLKFDLNKFDLNADFVALTLTLGH